MTRPWLVVAGLLVASVASAKSLPAGWKVTLKKGKPYLTAEKVTVQLVDSWNAWETVKASLSDDGSLELLYGECAMGIDDEQEPLVIPAATVRAKLENAQAMALHVKKKYADAAKLFEKAVADDPKTPVYATNLLSALAMGGEVERATKLLDTIGKDEVAWFAWRLAVDPELAKLKDTPAAKRFRADKAGALTSKKLGEGVALSPLGVAAVPTSDNFGSFMSFVQLSTGRETLRLPLKTSGKAVDGLLASMGFEVAAKKLAWHDEVEKVAGKLMDQLGDVKAAAVAGKHLVYVERTAGCDVSEFDFHAGAIKR